VSKWATTVLLVVVILEYWSALAELDSTFQKTAILSHQAGSKSWETSPFFAAGVPKKVEFTTSLSGVAK
jgi:hypothetical protein